MIRSESILRPILILLFTYIVAIGATFNGLLLPEFKPATLVIMMLTVAGWLFVRWRRGWCWHVTPLDVVFLLWGGAFMVSLLANLAAWRHVAMGLWYVSVYIVAWYGIQDALANRGLRRDTLVDALLITGLIVMIFGYMQVQSWLTNQWPLMRSGVVPFNLPRPVSLLGNSNALGCFLVVVLPFAIGRFLAVRRRLARVVLGLYTLLVALLLFLTYSRGAWLGAGGALVVLIVMLLLHHDIRSARRLREVWVVLSRRDKGLVTALSVFVLFVMVVGGALAAVSLTQSGRALELRTVLYQPAIDLFLEKPFSGHGLFTFGRGYARLVSMPPFQPHSHAHDVVLHLAAELGLPGLAALAVTVGVMGHQVRHSWRSAPSRERFGLMAGVAAIVGFGLQHLLDTPAMMPAIALTGLLALALTLAPFDPRAVTSIRQRPQTLILLAAVLVIGGTGFWSANLYGQYVEVLREAVRSGSYRTAAERMQPIIQADSSLAIYLLEQAYLFGLAASEGDMDAAQMGVEAYERFTAFEPQHAVSWANLAALYWQLGQRDSALDAMQRAVDLAPRSWQLAFNLAAYAEADGDLATARAYYAQALSSYTRPYPAWDETELRRQIAGETKLAGLTQVVFDLEAGQLEFAQQAWDALAQERAADYVVGVMLSTASGHADEASGRLAQAARIAPAESPQDQAWVHLGRALVARFDGREDAAEREAAAARELIAPGLLVEDYVYGVNIAYYQFLRTAISRQFLPQVYYPTADPLLARLLSAFDPGELN